MPTTITMPQLGETVTEGTVAQWLKKPGDRVEKYEAFVEVSTDKVNAEVPAPVSGVIRELIVKEGETVPTGTPIAIIDEVGAATTAPNGSASPPEPAARRAEAPRSSPNGAGSAAVSSTPGGLRVSPAVRRLAREHRVDLGGVRGSGDGGRITAKDILAAAQPGPSAGVATAIAPSGRPSYAAARPGELIPLSPARKLIAQRMVES
ncbi:MAG: biotin/lipoyl-containing protein, partial [Vulcanimicrobiaceae bacterium]